jgi:NAD(P)-dependent dehydrogenase (short-subunit alcohol dehydrogenase family)
MGEPVVVIAGIGRSGQTGEAVAAAFAERGWRSVVIDRSAEEVEARADRLRQRGGEADPFAADLTDPDALRGIIDELAKMGRSEFRSLVCLAGGYEPTGPVSDSEVATFHRLLGINLTTAYLTTRAFLPGLRAAGGRGSIVYFAADAALPGGRAAGNSAYVAAKSGVIALMRAVAEEERGAGVRANAVAPTQIRTASNLTAIGENARYVEREDVAETVFWLCSDDAAAVTGQTIRLA